MDQNLSDCIYVDLLKANPRPLDMEKTVKIEAFRLWVLHF